MSHTQSLHILLQKKLSNKLEFPSLSPFHGRRRFVYRQHLIG